MASSSSSNAIFERALNELMTLSGKTEADHVRSFLEKLHVMIYEMGKVHTTAGNDSLHCQQLENNKLKALTNFIDQIDDAIRRKEGYVDIMDLR
nr:hypothetical protein [Tanacetum cinerariifolium]